MTAYSYRADPAVPKFADDCTLIVFDGECRLCSRWVDFVFRHDRDDRIRVTTAQGPLGAALFTHYDLVSDGDYDTVLVLRDGELLTESDSTFALLDELGWPWRAGTVFRLVPRIIRDGVYRFVARNRFRIWGRRETCRLPTAADRARFL